MEEGGMTRTYIYRWCHCNDIMRSTIGFMIALTPLLLLVIASIKSERIRKWVRGTLDIILEVLMP